MKTSGILPLLGAIVLAACQKVPETPVFTVDYDAYSLNFTAGGGEFPVTVHWKACKVKVSSSGVLRPSSSPSPPKASSR